MKINELLENILNEDEIRDAELLKMGDTSLTAGDVADALSIEPSTALKYGKDIVNFLSSEIRPGYTTGEAALDVATVIPLLRASKWVIGPILARKELQATTKKQVGKEIQKGATRQTGKEIVTRNVSKGSAFNTPSDKSSSDTAQPKKRRYSIGDMINVNYQGMTIKGVVKNVIPGGYSIGLPDGKTVSIPEPIMESPTQGSTSAADVTVGAVYPNKKVKNSKNKDGTVKNALDMDANLLTGGSLVKR
jgi:hypothetical protein